MPSRADICRLCDVYMDAVSRRDIDAVTALFADDATQQDPIGTTPNVGRAEIRAFFEGIPADTTLRMTRLGPVTVVGNHAAFQALVNVRRSQVSHAFTTTDVITVDEDGRITELLAFPDREANPDDAPAVRLTGAAS